MTVVGSVRAPVLDGAQSAIEAAVPLRQQASRYQLLFERVRLGK